MRVGLRFVPDMISIGSYSVPEGAFELVSNSPTRRFTLGESGISCVGVIVELPSDGLITRTDGSSFRQVLLRNRHSGEFALKSGSALYVEDVLEEPQLTFADPIALRHQNIGVASLESTAP